MLLIVSTKLSVFKLRAALSAGVLSSFLISGNFDLLTLESFIIKTCFIQNYALYES